MKNKIYTPEVIETVKTFYPDYGGRICVEKTGLTLQQIGHVARNILKIKVKNRSKVKLFNCGNTKTAFDPTPFLTPNSPEVAYVLGMLWADGYTGTNQSCTISVSLVSEDFEGLKNLFLKTGKWKFYERQREHWKRSTEARINNRKFYEFLLENDYKGKSYESADKILEKIPENLRHYWFRGLVDGDGCFYVNQKLGLFQFAVTSTWQQDWGYFTKLLNRLGVKFSLTRRVHRNKGKNNSRSSTVRVTGRENLKRLGNFLYPLGESGGIGIQRKFEKFKEIPGTKPKSSKYIGVTYNQKHKSWRSCFYDSTTKTITHLGSFKTEEEAWQKRQEFVKKFHGTGEAGNT